MVDYDLFKKILEHGDDGYIESGDYLDSNMLLLLSKGNQEKVRSLFKKSNGALKKMTFSCEVKCTNCGKMMLLHNCTKTKVFEIIKAIRKNRDVYKIMLCPECNLKLKSKLNTISHNISDELIKENTEKYISIYLDPNKHWINISLREKLRNLNFSHVDKIKIKDYIECMNYVDFLNTPYWKAISEEVKKKAHYKCQICNGNKKLQVHHRSYENHGLELYHLEDLICLCEDCHTKYHFKHYGTNRKYNYR